ncbi:MAG: polyphenol oxidase family protein [Elusimicrobiota bacterium]
MPWVKNQQSCFWYNTHLNTLTGEWLIHFMTDRNYGDFSVKERRKKLYAKIGLDYSKIISGSQVHGSKVMFVNGKVDKDDLENTDGLVVTADESAGIVVYTADCAPVWIVDTVKRVVGLVHSGKEGTKKGIVVTGIDLMTEKCGCKKQNMAVIIGPHIQSCCYPYDIETNIVQQAETNGITKNNIYRSGLCTSCNNASFYSYRKEKGVTGRMASVAYIKQGAKYGTWKI